MKAIVIDNETWAVKGLVFLLEKYCPNVEVVDVATNALDGVKLINKLRPNIIFLDIEMPKLNGFEVLEKIADRSAHVVFITAHDFYAFQAIKHNPVDYLLKPVGPKELVEVVKKSEALINREEHIRKIESRFKAENEGKAEVDLNDIFKNELTKREIEILQVFLKTKSSKEISAQVHLSPLTVDKHLQNIYKKLKVGNKFDLLKKIRHKTDIG